MYHVWHTSLQINKVMVSIAIFNKSCNLWQTFWQCELYLYARLNFASQPQQYYMYYPTHFLCAWRTSLLSLAFLSTPYHLTESLPPLRQLPFSISPQPFLLSIRALLYYAAALHYKHHISLNTASLHHTLL
jgi:hypothetical protein